MNRYDMSGMYDEYWMSACDDGEYVMHSEAQAEITRLQAEVERLHDVRETMAVMWAKEKERSDTAWNDAIEAAASLHDKMSDEVVAFRIKNRGACMEYEENNHPKHAAAIRPLKRPT